MPFGGRIHTISNALSYSDAQRGSGWVTHCPDHAYITVWRFKFPKRSGGHSILVIGGDVCGERMCKKGRAILGTERLGGD